MTFAFAAFTFGAIFIFTAFKDMNIADFLRGDTNEDANTASFLPTDVQSRLVAYATGGGSGTGGSGQATLTSGTSSGGVRTGRGLKTWTNPDGSKEAIAAWIYAELIRLGAKGKIQINSGFRTYAEQVEACKHASPCATPGTSNHEKKTYPGGAIDVQNYDTLNALIRRKGGSSLKWYGSGDVWHFSATGR